MKKKSTIAISLALVGGLIFFFMTACSPLKKLANWSPFHDTEEKRYRLTDEEVAKFASTIRPGQENANSHYRLACFYQEGKKHRFAIEEFAKAIHIDPNYAKAYSGMGVSYDLLGDFSRAAECYQAALKLNPDLDYVYNNLGYSYLLQGDLDSAIDAFKKAVALNEKNKRYHNNLALAYGKKGQFDLAFAEFKVAGGETKARHNMAKLFNHVGPYEEAKTYIAKAESAKTPLDSTNEAPEEAETVARLSKPENEETLESSLTTPLPEADTKSCEEKKAATPSAISTEAIKENKEPEVRVQAENGEENLERGKDTPHYTVQVGAFTDPEKAEKVMARLEKDGHDSYIDRGVVERKNFYRVRVGKFKTREETEKEAIKIKTEEGLETYIAAKKIEAEDLMPADEDFQAARGEDTLAVSVHRTDEREGNDLEEAPIALIAVAQPTTDKAKVAQLAIRERSTTAKIEAFQEQDPETDIERLNSMKEIETREETEKEAKKLIPKEVLKPYNILFEFEKWDIHPGSEETLKKIGEIITAHKSPKVVISGHTDSKGSEEYNQKLSGKRAESIKKWLSENAGINPEIMETIAYGEARPIAPNARADGSDNPEGRQKNRRVEIVIKKGEETLISYSLHSK